VVDAGVDVVAMKDSNKFEDKVNIGVVQAYSELADEIASSKGVKLSTTIPNEMKPVLTVLRVLIYLGWIFMGRPLYQRIRYNDIIQKKEAFDKRYRITLTGTDRIKLPTDSDFHRPVEDPVKLTKGKNTFHYVIESHEGSALEDANVTFELTRPHTTEDDQLFRDIQGANGIYVIKDVNISKPGRYTLQLRVVVDKNTIGYSKIPAYLKP